MSGACKGDPPGPSTWVPPYGFGKGGSMHSAAPTAAAFPPPSAPYTIPAAAGDPITNSVSVLRRTKLRGCSAVTRRVPEERGVTVASGSPPPTPLYELLPYGPALKRNGSVASPGEVQLVPGTCPVPDITNPWVATAALKPALPAERSLLGPPRWEGGGGAAADVAGDAEDTRRRLLPLPGVYNGKVAGGADAGTCDAACAACCWLPTLCISRMRCMRCFRSEITARTNCATWPRACVCHIRR
ncbi:hypothetical protein Vafri_19475 [Volvox africanus]|uniref:Uncharacterized protein n=1 Tax=Volvox africanus TaxID=51714 RepID=A0A8J4BNC3_9CHLO|nr:hypothetical protein Vafri_19475 [Volvox africanus]